GVSNFDVEDLEEAAHALTRHPIACNQVLYHLGERTIEHRVMPYCLSKRIAIVAYSPFARQDFVKPGSRGGRTLAQVAQAHGASPRQVALAFLTRNDDAFAIPKAVGKDHVRENAAAGDLVLTSDDVAEIDAAFPLSRRSGVLPTA
ncbi:MAG: aldo/keto reductase, partial [Candidatus Eremiobacteraeota bacterium]|nr:aldo/keto reductase [Candidatus Eremiobacteraeota bacterium]